MEYWYSASIARRYKTQNRFKTIGKFAIFSIFFFITILLGSITYQALPAFKKTYIAVDISLDNNMSSRKAIHSYMNKRLEATDRKSKREVRGLFSNSASFELDKYKKENAGLKNENVRIWVSASENVDQFLKGKITRETSENRRKFKNRQMEWVKKLQLTEQIRVQFNTDFFNNADSRDASQAGILGAVMGSLMTIVITLFLSLFIGVLSAIYLEEFAPRNSLTFLIEMAINNLAAVPSIIFGLLGLAILLNTIGLPRSASITGGVVLAMMSLPTIIIVTRNAIKAVPDSLRSAGLALGSTRLQVVFKHILPCATPSIFTGVIIAMAQALGETAPLLMIGMIAFIADTPSSFTDSAVTLPVQIYLWADVPEVAFIEKTSAAILVLLMIVFIMIATAGYIRNKFEK